MDEQVPTVQHGELYSIISDKPEWKRIFKKNMYMYIIESLCCTAELNTTLDINYTSL